MGIWGIVPLTYHDFRDQPGAPARLEIIPKADHTYTTLADTARVIALVKQFVA